MKTSVLFLIASAAMAQTAKPTGGALMSGTGTLRSGIVVQFKTVVEPPMSRSEMSSFSGGISAKGDVVHRVMWDDSNYFGYDLAVTRDVAGGTFRVAFQPLSVNELSGKENLVPAPQPAFPAPANVREGDTIGLTLLVSDDGKYRIVDYIQIVSSQPTQARAAVAPRDLTLDDSPVTFDAIPAASVWIGGQKAGGGLVFTAKPGATFWIHFPGRPMYILSLAPVQGSERAGTVRENVMSFQADGQQYEIHLNSPVARTGRAFNLYLLRNLDYQPPPELANTVVGGVDRLDNLLAQH